MEATIGRYDHVVQRIAREHHVRRSTAEQWFTELVRFLDLVALYEEPLAPSKRVDRAWHEFLLHTREYAAFCDERYGRFLHHDPYAKPDSDAYRRTYDALRANGVKPHRRIWPDPYAPYGSGGGGGCGGDGGGGSCGSGSCGGGGCGGGGG
jgi:hypothetical protein